MAVPETRVDPLIIDFSGLDQEEIESSSSSSSSRKRRAESESESDSGVESAKKARVSPEDMIKAKTEKYTHKLVAMEQAETKMIEAKKKCTEKLEAAKQAKTKMMEAKNAHDEALHALDLPKTGTNATAMAEKTAIKAKQAHEKAEEAHKKAEEAHKKAQEAYKKAQEAHKKAEEAHKKAEEALAKSEEALAKSEERKEAKEAKEEERKKAKEAKEEERKKAKEAKEEERAKEKEKKLLSAAFDKACMRYMATESVIVDSITKSNRCLLCGNGILTAVHLESGFAVHPHCVITKGFFEVTQAENIIGAKEMAKVKKAAEESLKTRCAEIIAAKEEMQASARAGNVE
jgi:hypothetical protein